MTCSSWFMDVERDSPPTVALENRAGGKSRRWRGWRASEPAGAQKSREFRDGRVVALRFLKHPAVVQAQSRDGHGVVPGDTIRRRGGPRDRQSCSTIHAGESATRVRRNRGPQRSRPLNRGILVTRSFAGHFNLFRLLHPEGRPVRLYKRSRRDRVPDATPFNVLAFGWIQDQLVRPLLPGN
jgi:hypothetical protein